MDMTWQGNNRCTKQVMFLVEATNSIASIKKLVQQATEMQVEHDLISKMAEIVHFNDIFAHE